MSAAVPDRLIVTGTDTGVGKTVLAALVTLALDGVYWKPVQSGLDGETDSEAVLRMTGLPPDRVLPEAYRLTAPRSPDQSARLDGVCIRRECLTFPESSRPLVIEGAGGPLAPLSDSLMQADLFAMWGAPVVVAARSGLGTINHTLLTVEALARRGVLIVGVALIGDEHPENMRSLSVWTDVPIIGTVRRLKRLDRESLIEEYRRRFTPIEEWKHIIKRSP